MIKKKIRKAFQKIAAPVFKNELKSISAIASTYQQMIETDRPDLKIPGASCEGIVFSKDRAMQLHALLSSYFAYVINPVKLSVFYTTSNKNHTESYHELKLLFADKDIVFIKEESFKPDLEKLLTVIKTDNVFFMTDDGLFIDSFDMKEVISFNPLLLMPSLTKGLDLTYCYIQNKKQKLPEFIVPDNTLLPPDMKCWEWGKAEQFSDWAYPLSLDVTFYDKKEIQLLLANIPYKAPNSLETALHINYAPIFLQRKGLCFNKAKYVNIVCNVVNTEHKNRNTGLHTIEDLLKRWLDGYRIQYESFYGKNCADAETAFFNFIKR